MSWYVFTQDELDEIAETNEKASDLVDRLLEKGEWTEDDTLLVEPRGMDNMALAGHFDKLPRRMAGDPPLNTEPAP